MAWSDSCEIGAQTGCSLAKSPCGPRTRPGRWERSQKGKMDNTAGRFRLGRGCWKCKVSAERRQGMFVGTAIKATF